MLHRCLLLVNLIALTVGARPDATASGPTGDSEGNTFFERRVRPVFLAHCVECHGSEDQQNGLRLDVRSASFKGGDSGPAIVPGKPNDSLLIQAVRRVDGLEMPPDQPLNRQQVADLAAWVKMGAPWPETAVIAPSPNEVAWKNHWSFQPITDPTPPAINDRSWARTVVDRFIVKKLEAAGLSPSAPADRRTLIRRATFDLIGLPPTPEEVSAFEQDRLPDAFARLLDRLLASPRYGERWGRHWLDVARYADTKGYVFFEEKDLPFAYTYRDYVIAAFNEDLPYDQFLVEQLAADQIVSRPNGRSLAAMGFLTLGARFMNNPHDVIDDRIDVVSRGLLGLTVTCARCHDHKYDPIPTADYYSLYGVFNNSVEPTVQPLATEPPDSPEYSKFDAELQSRVKKLKRFVHEKHSALVEGARSRVAEYLMAAHAAREQPVTDNFMLLADGDDLNPTMIRRWEVYLKASRRERDPVFSIWHALADIPQETFASQSQVVIERLVSPHQDGNQVNCHVADAFAGDPPQSLQKAAETYERLFHETLLVWQRSRQPAAGETNPSTTQPLDADWEQLCQVLYGRDAPPNVRLPVLGDLLTLLPDRPAQAELKKLLKAVEEWQTKGRGAPPRAMTLVDVSDPVEPVVFIRGNPNRRGQAVPRRFLGVLAGSKRQAFSKGSGRLELARAIASPTNPLTARVIVNRLWMHHFGAALVRTPGDFGIRGDRPTHPSLLDYLASNMIRQDWSIKRIHRAIMLSAVYQQSCADRAECSRVDPENRLLWKMNRRRLGFESTRDAMLAVAASLDSQIGGPSVDILKQPFPRRRTLYAYLDRLNVPSLFRTFDVPSPVTMSPQRSLTTVAPQALFFFNHPFVADCAAWTAQRPDVANEHDIERRLKRVYEVVFNRAPTAQERILTTRFFGKFPLDAKQWQQYVQALMMTNEFVFVD